MYVTFNCSNNNLPLWFRRISTICKIILYFIKTFFCNIRRQNQLWKEYCTFFKLISNNIQCRNQNLIYNLHSFFFFKQLRCITSSIIFHSCFHRLKNFVCQFWTKAYCGIIWFYDFCISCCNFRLNFTWIINKVHWIFINCSQYFICLNCPYHWRYIWIDNRKIKSISHSYC